MTVAEIKKLIADQMEDNSIPCLIVDTLIPHDGKKLTTRHEKLLRDAGVPNARIIKHYGWTDITWDDKNPNAVNSLMVARAETNVTIDANWMLTDNTNCRWFKALDDRNQTRKEILANEELLEKTAKAIAAFVAAKKELEGLLTYDNFEGERFALQAIAGLKSS